MSQKDRSREATAALITAKWFAALVCFSLCAPAEAHAYIDPGSGALIWQALLAAFFGGLFYYRRAVGHLKAWFSAKSKKPDEVTTKTKD